ncbi:hypothetical protein PUN28_002534 [Cardiocondyla obscurior]|uniref:Uncharacterized protein n=1 Tax=Cardiocondyla obscurior TaxID=286306 RepID=A0AAW2GUV5_9HYME
MATKAVACVSPRRTPQGGPVKMSNDSPDEQQKSRRCIASPGSIGPRRHRTKEASGDVGAVKRIVVPDNS